MQTSELISRNLKNLEILINFIETEVICIFKREEINPNSPSTDGRLQLCFEGFERQFTGTFQCGQRAFVCRYKNIQEFQI